MNAPRRRGWLLGGAATVTVAVAIVVVSVAVRGRPSAVPTAPLTASYAVVYRVEQNGAPSWEVLAVARPLRGSDLTYDTTGPPGPQDHPVAGSISEPTALFTVNSSGVHVVSGRQPGPPTNDELLTVDLRALLARRVACDLHATERVAGQTCRVLRFAEPPSGAIRALDAGTTDHDDICLTATGLVLSERWTYHDRLVLVRTAVTVHPTDANVVPAPPATADATPAPQVAPSVAGEASGTSVIAAPPPPDHFTPWQTPYRLRIPDPQDPTATEATSLTWAFVNGAQVISIEAGNTRGGALPWQPGDTVANDVHLAGLGAATTAMRSDGSEVRVDLGNRGWVRIRGTVPLDTLVAYANGLRLAG